MTALWAHPAWALVSGGLLMAVAVLLWRTRQHRQALMQAETLRLRAEAAAERVPGLEQALEDQRAAQGLASREQARLQAELLAAQRSAEEKLSLLQATEQRFAESFRALSARALEQNNTAFLQLANETLQRFQQGAQQDLGTRQKAIEAALQPVKESLGKFDERVAAMERQREGAYQALREQLRQLSEHQLPRLQSETQSLVKALRQPQGRGRWGELQLRRVIEMAGMMEHCDFSEQTSTTQADAQRLRPDVIVRLPGARRIVIDAKAPLDAYLSALESEDEAARREHLKRHALQLRQQIRALGDKRYFSQFDDSVDFVVLFVPGEAFFSAALAEDPALFDEATDRRVMLASPTTLIALLKAVAYGWRQEAVARSARDIAALGKELAERLGTFAGHLGKTGNALGSAVKHYNSAVASLESRVLVSARKFEALGAGGSDAEALAPPEPVAGAIRPLAADGEADAPDTP
jgi:DNA recombination protein RmuC